MGLEGMPRREPFSIQQNGPNNPVWIDWLFKALTEINDKLDNLSSYSSGNFVKVGAEGQLEDSGVSSSGDNISLEDVAGDISLGIGSWTDLTWDTESDKDTPFQHDDGAATVKLAYSGTATIIFHGTLYVDTHVNTTLVKTKVQRDTGNDFVDVPTTTSGLSFSYDAQELNFSVTKTLNVNKGDIIKCVSSATSGGSTIKTLADSFGLKIYKGN